MTPRRRHVYSPQRLRRVVLLLALITLPAVVGVATLIYYYLRFSVRVEERLRRDRLDLPTPLYARPLVLRPGLPLDITDLVRTLNGLRYEQKSGVPENPGEFAVAETALVFRPRPAPGGPGEPVVVRFEKGHVKELQGAETKLPLASATLERELITYLFEPGRERRRAVKYESLPRDLVQAVLAIEDRRFFTHPGLDPFRIVGAAIRNLQAESYIQGGSTITQQLCKNFFLTPERTIRRKAEEAVLAFVLERRATKEQILELYLNEIYLGQVGSFEIRGMGEAARMYFHKDVANLSLIESALLAGMIQSPNPLNPLRHADRARERRNVVLRSMVEAGFIPAPTAEAAATLPVRVETGSLETVDAPYFVDFVTTELASRPRGEAGGIAVQSSLDLQLQGIAQRALANGLQNAEKMLGKRSDPARPVQGAIIALEPATGHVVAMVGGRAYGQSQYNRAVTAHRQTGSTFKPFVFLAAFEAGFDDPALPPLTPATVVEDAPAVFFYEDKEYIPQNYEDEYKGPVTLRRALASSLNVATVKVAEMIGYDRVAHLWTDKLQINDAVKGYPALALGSFEATPLEMATAYAVLANQGIKVQPTGIERVLDPEGRELVDPHAPPRRQVVRPESAFLVTHMLRSVLNNGTAAGARTAMGFKEDAAGKTGTTNELRDAWFIGYTPDLLCAVWVGRDDNTPIRLTGARVALPIWVDFMKQAGEGRPARQFTAPAENVVFVDIDPETGELATPWCPKVFPEAFVAGTEPRQPCLQHAPYGESEEQPELGPLFRE